jgi:hypothetical protein
MQSAGWEMLLRHIPPEVHHTLMLVTRGGTEFAISNLMRVDREFVAIRGRLAATQDQGRVFFIAYDQIDYFGFQQALRESEFEQMFAGLVMPEPEVAAAPAAADNKASAATEAAFAVARAVAAAAGTAVAPAPAASAEPATAAPAAAPGTGSRTTNPVIKSAVLERFRARSQGQSGSGERPQVGG